MTASTLTEMTAARTSTASPVKFTGRLVPLDSTSTATFSLVTNSVLETVSLRGTAQVAARLMINKLSPSVKKYATKFVS